MIAPRPSFIWESTRNFGEALHGPCACKAGVEECHGLRVSTNTNADRKLHGMAARYEHDEVLTSRRNHDWLVPHHTPYHVKIKLPCRLSADNEKGHCVLDPHGKNAPVNPTTDDEKPRCSTASHGVKGAVARR